MVERTTFLLAFAGIAALLGVVASVSAQTAPSDRAGAQPTPTFFLGDVSCDGNVNSIDAALVLQREAGIIASLPCAENADMNNDGSINSVDAGLILQYNAGLMNSPVRFSLNVHRPEGLCDDPEKPAKCDIPAASEFGLSVLLNRPPSEGYIGAQTQLFYGELRYNPTMFADEEIVWPDQGLALRGPNGDEPLTGTEGLVWHSGLTGIAHPLRASTYRGSLVEISISCSVQPQTFTLALLPYRPAFTSAVGTFGSGVALPSDDDPRGPVLPGKTVAQLDLDLDLSGTIEPEEEQVEVAATLDINCVAPATPTP